MCMILVEGGGIPVCRQLQRGWNNCKIKLNFIVLETLSLKVFRPEKASFVHFQFYNLIYKILSTACAPFSTRTEI